MVQVAGVSFGSEYCGEKLLHVEAGSSSDSEYFRSLTPLPFLLKNLTNFENFELRSEIVGCKHLILKHAVTIIGIFYIFIAILS